MHCISSSICFWVWTIFRETIEALSKYTTDDDDDEDEDETRISEVNFLEDHPVAYALTNYNKRGAQILTNYINSTVRRFTHVCDLDEGMKKIYKNYSPYLYPFSVEYSILVGRTFKMRSQMQFLLFIYFSWSVVYYLAKCEYL